MYIEFSNCVHWLGFQFRISIITISRILHFPSPVWTALGVFNRVPNTSSPQNCASLSNPLKKIPNKRLVASSRTSSKISEQVSDGEVSIPFKRAKRNLKPAKTPIPEDPLENSQGGVISSYVCFSVAAGESAFLFLFACPTGLRNWRLLRTGAWELNHYAARPGLRNMGLRGNIEGRLDLGFRKAPSSTYSSSLYANLP